MRNPQLQRSGVGTMESITCKFGGTSLADAAAIRVAMEIVRSDPRRRFVVASAPGKRDADDKKVTDLFLGWFHALQSDVDTSQPIEIVTQRFSELAGALGAAVDVESEIRAIEEAAKAEIKYLADLTNSGSITGMGEAAGSDDNTKKIDEELGETFRRLGLSEAGAAIAVAGRK